LIRARSGEQRRSFLNSGKSRVHGFTYDGQYIWFASGDKLNAVDPASGKTVNTAQELAKSLAERLPICDTDDESRAGGVSTPETTESARTESWGPREKVKPGPQIAPVRMRPYFKLPTTGLALGLLARNSFRMLGASLRSLPSHGISGSGDPRASWNCNELARRNGRRRCRDQPAGVEERVSFSLTGGQAISWRLSKLNDRSSVSLLPVRSEVFHWLQLRGIVKGLSNLRVCDVARICRTCCSTLKHSEAHETLNLDQESAHATWRK
jgi:hypothetical protein